MKSRSIRRYAGALLCSAPALSAAQQAAPPAPELDTITVTAQRVPTDGRTLPVSISVITAEAVAYTHLDVYKRQPMDCAI